MLQSIRRRRLRSITALLQVVDKRRRVGRWARASRRCTEGAGIGTSISSGLGICKERYMGKLGHMAIQGEANGMYLASLL